jgi:hypothetical protein
MTQLGCALWYLWIQIINWRGNVSNCFQFWLSPFHLHGWYWEISIKLYQLLRRWEACQWMLEDAFGLGVGSSRKAKHLSLAGRVTLYKSVLAAIPLYSMQSSLILKSTCYEIKKICRSFIWGQKEDKNKIHLIWWNELCKPKLDGGIGIRKMHSVNEANYHEDWMGGHSR